MKSDPYLLTSHTSFNGNTASSHLNFLETSTYILHKTGMETAIDDWHVYMLWK